MTTDPSRPGVSTLEGKLAIAGVIFGAVISGLTVTFGMLAESFPEFGWLGVLAGAFSVGASVFGISKARGQVKGSEILATAAKAIAGAMGPGAGLSILGVNASPSAPVVPLQQPAPPPNPTHPR